MDRRSFIKGSGAGLIAFLLGGCSFFMGDEAKLSSSAKSTAGAAQGGRAMKITVITGSPHERGTSALLADRFIEGAKQAGHEVFRFNAAFEEIHPCVACGRCGRNGPCVHRDAIEEKLTPNLRAADLVVFVTPLYYFGMSAQLKTVVDRFFSSHTTLSGGGKKAILMATAYDSREQAMADLTHHYQTIVKYLGWEDIGTVLAVGCGSRSLIENSKFPEEAHQLGQSV